MSALSDWADQEGQRIDPSYAGDLYDEETDTAVDWLLAVRKYGIERANEMFPEG